MIIDQNGLVLIFFESTDGHPFSIATSERENDHKYLSCSILSPSTTISEVLLKRFKSIEIHIVHRDIA